MKKQIILLLTLVLMISFVFAVPSLPHAFAGKVEYSASPKMSLTGYDISASIGSYGLGVVGQVQENNLYEVFVDPQGRVGMIYFYIGGIEAEETEVYEWGGNSEDSNLTINELPSYGVCGNGFQEPGEQCDNIQLGTGTCENVLGILGATGNLSCTEECTFDYSGCTAPFCGDGTCNNDETCSTCSNDCGICPTTSSGGGGGGGSSGGGGGGSSTSSTSKNDGGIVLLEQEEEIEEDKQVEENFSEPTVGTGLGAVLGFVKSIKGVGLVFGLVVLVVGTVVFFIQKKDKPSKEAVSQTEE